MDQEVPGIIHGFSTLRKTVIYTWLVMETGILIFNANSKQQIWRLENTTRISSTLRVLRIGTEMDCK